MIRDISLLNLCAFELHIMLIKNPFKKFRNVILYMQNFPFSLLLAIAHAFTSKICIPNAKNVSWEWTLVEIYFSFPI